ncbi:RTC4-like domain-containing protein [Mycena alexandri]|uniref:Restriction of telomere capping protein 4 n=1 Tax=Mycena alexandri TaxID=1745969 RepID=A0AAD6SL66_9AGAR|nr:RTC4-like domain-containing protein [Mycena alexandri]
MERGRYPKELTYRPGSQPMDKGVMGVDFGSSFGEKEVVDLDCDDDDFDELNCLPPKSSQPGRATSRPPIPEKREKRETDEVIRTLKFYKNKKPDADTPTSKENTRRAADKKAAVLLAQSKNAVASSSTRPLRDNAASRNRSPDSRLAAKHGDEKVRSTPDAKPPRPRPRPRVPPTPQPKPVLKRTISVVSIPESPKKPENAGFPAPSPIADSKNGLEKKKKRLIADFGRREGKGKEREREMTQKYPQEGLSPFSSPTKSLSCFLPSPLGTPNHKEKLSSNGFPAPSPLRPEGSARTRREAFPMNTQDFDGISSPVKRRSLGSDSDDERDRKRYKNHPVVVSGDYEEDDSELLFISPGTDPKTLCPYCDTPLPAQPTPLLTRLLEQTFKKSYRDARPSNPLGRKAPMGVFVTVCQRHRFESETLPEAEARGWPKFIDWAGLTGRVLAMRGALEGILADPGDPIVYGNDNDGEQKVGSQPGKRGPRMRCLFWKDLVMELKTKGSKGVKGVQGQFANFEKTQPGYYGELGSVIIHQTLYDMFPLTNIDPVLVDPLTPNEFIQRILVPEVGMRLVIEDMDLDSEDRTDKKRAVAVLRDSASYGVAMFPEDGGDWAGVSGKKNREDDEAMGVADLMVMERARKRRKELEIEEREEDEAWQAQQEREEAEKQRAKAEVAKEKRRARRKAKEKEKEAEPVVVDLTTRPRPRPLPKNKAKATVAADPASGMDTGSGMDTDSSSDPRPSRNDSDMEMMAVSSSQSSPEVEAVATPRPRSPRGNKVKSPAETFDDDSDFPLEVAAAAPSKRVKAKPKAKSSKRTTESSEPEVESDAGKVRISPRPRSPSASLTSGKRLTRGISVLDLCSSSEGGSGVDNANPKPRKAERVAPTPRRKPRKSIPQLPASSDEDDDVQATPRATVGVASSSSFRPLDAARRRAPAAKG